MAKVARERRYGPTVLSPVIHYSARFSSLARSPPPPELSGPLASFLSLSFSFARSSFPSSLCFLLLPPSLSRDILFLHELFFCAYNALTLLKARSRTSDASFFFPLALYSNFRTHPLPPPPPVSFATNSEESIIGMLDSFPSHKSEYSEYFANTALCTPKKRPRFQLLS